MYTYYLIFLVHFCSYCLTIIRSLPDFVAIVSDAVTYNIALLCFRAFNESQSCLDVLLDACEYTELYEFIGNMKVPYLGTVASLCNFGNVITGTYAT